MNDAAQYLSSSDLSSYQSYSDLTWHLDPFETLISAHCIFVQSTIPNHHPFSILHFTISCILPMDLDICLLMDPHFLTSTF